MGNNLPSPAETVQLFKQENIRRVRLYSPDKDVLTALRGSNIEVMLGLPNSPELERVAKSQSEADRWVQTNVTNYINDVNFRYISVGNELHIRDYYAQFLVQAMENIDRAVSRAGLDGRIKVSTAVDMTVLEASCPPSKGSFHQNATVLMDPIIRFLVKKQSPLHLNLYTYFSYAGSKEISLDYALFKAPEGTVSDPPRSYQNLFDAMLDAVYTALERSGGESLEIVVSETGWPTNGGKATNVENAKTYNTNLINHVKKGTPKRPGRPIETYIFAMYDENQKSGDAVERFWGLFNPSKEPKYDINFA